MLKLNYRNLFFFFFVKYFLFYIILMFKNNDYTLVQISDLRTGEDVFFYLWLFLFFPVMCSLLFSVPLFLTLRARRILSSVLAIFVFIIAEYFLYTYLASQADLLNGIYNAILSLILLFVFFFRSIKFTTSSKVH